jgi:hypothetical protein
MSRNPAILHKSLFVLVVLYSDVPVQDTIVQFTMDIHGPADAKKRRG